MLRKVIEYTDYNGEKRKEAFYFNLSRAELIEMEMVTKGGMENLLQSIIDTKDNRKLFELFKELITKSYGVKTPDGKRFVKNADLTEAFVQSEAYTELLLELMGDDAAGHVSEFVKGIMPIDGLSDDEVNKAMQEVNLRIDTYQTTGETVVDMPAGK